MESKGVPYGRIMEDGYHKRSYIRITLYTILIRIHYIYLIYSVDIIDIFTNFVTENKNKNRYYL